MNIAPVLPAQSNRTVNELTLLTVTNRATDADVPANMLSYQLLNAPAGAAIGSTGDDHLDAERSAGPGRSTR